MYSDIGKALKMLFVGALIMFPLAMWKLIDILIWIFTHLTISFSWY